MTHVIPVGTTEAQEFRLHEDGVPLDGTNLEIGIAAVAVVTCLAVSGLIAEWLVAGEGTVAVTGLEALTVGDYDVRFSVTDQDGAIGYAPNGAKPDRWHVVR